MKKTARLLIVMSLVVIIIIALSVFFYNPDKLTPESPEGKTLYYTKIFNDERKLNDKQRYEYTLDTYDERGNKKALTFTSNKQLREQAYIELYVASFRGVTYWQEVQFDELPEQVQSVYSK